MATKRDVLAHLTRDELLAVVDRFTLAVPDRRAKEGLVEAVSASKKATLAEILPGYARERLKELCRALGLDDGGKEKAPIVERIVGGGGSKSEGAPSGLQLRLASQLDQRGEGQRDACTGDGREPHARDAVEAVMDRPDAGGSGAGQHANPFPSRAVHGGHRPRQMEPSAAAERQTTGMAVPHATVAPPMVITSAPAQSVVTRRHAAA
jgi:hypothetical protein